MATLLERTDELLAKLEPALPSPDRQTVIDARQRLHEPLRVAFAGRVKAGKSTLLNALVGEPLAATDAAECTRFVTWYVHGTHPIAHAVSDDGARTQVVHRVVDGRASIDLGPIDETRLQRLEVAHPTPHLAQLTLIDTPGIASISETVSERSTTFLVPDSRDQGADVLVYLLRFLHEQDPDFLEAFTDPTAHHQDPVRSVAVLSRADEIGAGRGDAFSMARSVADSYRRRPELRRQVSDVVAVSGLLALNGRTLTQADFQHLATIAALPLTEQDRLLLSADRFAAVSTLQCPAERRRSLLDRLGMTGVRLAVAALRSGTIDTAGRLADYLTTASGIDPLQRLLLERYATRADALKASRALDLVRALVSGGTAPGSFRGDLERVETNAHELEELWCLRDLARRRGEDEPESIRSIVGDVRPETVDAALGGRGGELHQRLGLAATVDPEDRDHEAVVAIARLRDALHQPLLPREGQRILEAATHSLELSYHRTTTASID